jgi:cobalt-zinc-cadmium efflux system outer membrane protein
VLQFGQEFELGGERWARRRAAAASADEARARLADARRTVEADVVEAYASAALADANERIARDSAGYLREEARIAEVRLSAGDISRSDLDQIELAATRLELDAESAANAARAQRLALETLLGIAKPDGQLVVADSLEALVQRMAAAGPGTPAGQRADVTAAEAEVRRADAAWQLEKAQRIPDVTLFFSLEHQPPDVPNTIGVGLALPLPLWNRNSGAIAAARASRDQAERAATHVRAQVIADTTTARAAFDEASTRWRRYRDEVRPRSEEVRRSVSLAYEKGGASLVDLLTAQMGDNDVRLATMQAANDAVIAAARLRAATTTTILEEARP